MTVIMSSLQVTNKVRLTHNNIDNLFHQTVLNSGWFMRQYKYTHSFAVWLPGNIWPIQTPRLLFLLLLFLKQRRIFPKFFVVSF